MIGSTMERRMRRLSVTMLGAVALSVAGLPGDGRPAPGPGAVEAQEPSAFAGAEAASDDASLFLPMDVFELEYASDPRISPDGSRVVYVRRSMDLMHDRERGDLWAVNADGSGHRALTAGKARHSSPRWSPDGTRLAYVTEDEDGRAQIFVRWMDTGQTTILTDLIRPPGGIAWAPDGRSIAFTRFVAAAPEPFARMPEKPEGAEWAPAARVIESVVYRRDGQGLVEEGHRHVFVVPAEGGTARQLTAGPYEHQGSPVWTPDGRALLVTANRHDGWQWDPQDTEIYEILLEDGSVRPLTARHGPDRDPAISPDGGRIAYLGFDERYQGYQVTRLYVMDRDGGGPRTLAEGLDRDVEDPVWSADGRGLYVRYDDEGTSKVAFVHLDGRVETVAEDVGGTTLGRPYPSGSFTVARNGRVAFTHTSPQRPADVAVVDRGRPPASDLLLTRLNGDLLGPKRLGPVEEIRAESSHDGRPIHGWIVKPPAFDPSRTYPLILEIHGGPFLNYGYRFSAEIQLYAATGYVVLYVNPRGSTSYGEEFGNLIHHAYPGNDYDDLMTMVDAAVATGYVDPERLYVTGGSGGGVLSSWIVGRTDRFRAAAVQKPVINWYSWALTADMYVTGIKYWFPGPPWEHPEHYLARSPISRVGNVTTPTMLITGEADLRTPISESEQFYQALKFRRVPTALVRIPEASHGIAERPSNLIGKVVHVLGWFQRHGGPGLPSRPLAGGG